jgi:hypothetical protein
MRARAYGNSSEHVVLCFHETQQRRCPPPPAFAAPSGQGTLITTICPQAGYPHFALEVPLPIAVSSFAQQLGLTGAGISRGRSETLSREHSSVRPTRLARSGERAERSDPV